MAPLCSRVGCGEPAVAVFGFDAVAALVWLDPFDGRTRGAGMLCVDHADTLTPLRGWTLQDRRVPSPRLWADRPRISASTRAAERRPRRARHAKTEPAPALPFDARAENVVVRVSELERLLDARSPLLERAFRTVRGHETVRGDE